MNHQIFVCYLAAPQLILGNYPGDIPSHSMVITGLLPIFDLKVTESLAAIKIMIFFVSVPFFFLYLVSFVIENITSVIWGKTESAVKSSARLWPPIFIFFQGLSKSNVSLQVWLMLRLTKNTLVRVCSGSPVTYYQ